jgi:mRNA interferase MazF
MTRGEVFRFAPAHGAIGREQKGPRFAVVVQADELLQYNTVLVAPTSTSAPAATFRPVVAIAGASTRVLVEQIKAVEPNRLGSSAGRLEAHELGALDEALSLVLGL